MTDAGPGKTPRFDGGATSPTGKNKTISINGISLTISKIKKNGFEINIIPHTLKLTNLIKLNRYDIVNVEFDIFSKYLLNLKK